MNDVPAGSPEASPRGRRGLRVLLVLLLVASGVAVLALAILGPSPDAHRVRTRVLALDHLAEEAYLQAHVDAYLRPAGDVSRDVPGKLADVLEKRVLPPLRAARAAVEGLTDVPDSERRLVDLLHAFTSAREAAYVAMVETLRTGGVQSTVASKTRMEEANRLREEIRALGE